ncbi:hypothetical protein ACFQ3Z_44600 [Streptomyces nogalater]
MRQAVKRIIDEAADRIVDEVIAQLTEPVNAKLEAMVEDMVLDLADDAFSMPPTAAAARDTMPRAGTAQCSSPQPAVRVATTVTRGRPPRSTMSSSKTVRERSPDTVTSCTWPRVRHCAGREARSGRVRAAIRSLRSSTRCSTARSRAPRRP